MTGWFWFDLLLLVLSTLRLSRLVTSDQIGEWFIQEPAKRWATMADVTTDYEPYMGEVLRQTDNPDGWRHRLVDGLICGFCEGYWIGVVTIVVLAMLGGPGDAPDWWRVLSGTFALSYVIGHVSARLD